MLFRLINAPTTFMDLMNKVFGEYLDKFVLIFIDDVLVYSYAMEEYELHFKLVLENLRENKLYNKFPKCHFLP